MPFNPGVDMGDWIDATADLSFGVDRQVQERTLVIATIRTHATGGNKASVDLVVSGTKVGQVSTNTNAGGLTGNPDSITEEAVTLLVNKGESYRFDNALDPATANAIVQVTERPF